MMPALNPEEQDLADALLLIVQEHGKFNEDNVGVWAGYTPAAENVDNAAIGVKCGNCVFWQAPNGCQIISAETEEAGLCRFAVLPDGAVVATAGSKPAPKKDQRRGSTKNKKGSASTGSGIKFTVAVTNSLKKKVAEHNEKAKPGRRVTLGKLKAVYRRGAGAFSSSHRPDQNRSSWSMARVNAFLKLVRSGKPSNPKYKQDNDLLPKLHPRHTEASTMGPVLASLVLALNDDECPPATQDVAVNLANREKAIQTAGYGPLNPLEPNDEFWQEKATRWSTTTNEAKKSVCGNCVMFIRTPAMLDCIEGGLSAGESGVENAWDAIDTAELGYCEAFDFKCAASRTCSAWVVGGPIVDDSEPAPVALTLRARVASAQLRAGVDVDVSTVEVFGRQPVTLATRLKSLVKDSKPDETRGVPVDRLVPTQRTVNMLRVADTVGDKPIQVLAVGDNYQIVDGHHRATARKLAGDSTITAEVYYGSKPQRALSTEDPR